MTLNRREGLRRIGIVVAVLWFGFWGMRAVYWGFRWLELRFDNDWPFVTGDVQAKDFFWESIITSFLWPALAYGTWRIGRWVYLGFVVSPFEQSEAPSDEQ